MMLLKQKKCQPKGTQILLNITVAGSAGPIRFVVREEDPVAVVTETALKIYAREGRLPLLGNKLSDFFLYTPIAGTEALCPWEMIGKFGVRNFMLCKKPQQAEKVVEISRKNSGGRNWKSCFNRSLIKITSH